MDDPSGERDHAPTTLTLEEALARTSADRDAIDLSTVEAITPEVLAALLAREPEPPTTLALGVVEFEGALATTIATWAPGEVLLLPRLQRVTPEAAAALAAWRGAIGLTRPSVAVVRALAPCEGPLVIEGTEVLGLELARALEGYAGDGLTLADVERVEAGALAPLLAHVELPNVRHLEPAAWRGLRTSIALPALERIDADLARVIAAHTPDVVLGGALADVEAARALAMASDSLTLDGVEAISPVEAEAFAGFGGSMMAFARVRRLEARAAALLFGWHGAELHLPGLEVIPDTMAPALASWPGRALGLSGLREASDVIVDALVALEGRVSLAGPVARRVEARRDRARAAPERVEARIGRGPLVVLAAPRRPMPEGGWADVHVWLAESIVSLDRRALAGAHVLARLDPHHVAALVCRALDLTRAPWPPGLMIPVASALHAVRLARVYGDEDPRHHGDLALVRPLRRVEREAIGDDHAALLVCSIVRLGDYGFGDPEVIAALDPVDRAHLDAAVAALAGR